MNEKGITSKDEGMSAFDYALLSHSEYWSGKEVELKRLIEAVSFEVIEMEKHALIPQLPRNKEEARHVKAIWTLSGVGTYEKPIAMGPGDMIYVDKPWAHGTDKKRTDHAIDLVKKISIIASGKYQPEDSDTFAITNEELEALVIENGPYLVYNGIPSQNEDLIDAIQKRRIFPIEKLFIPEGDIERTLDQVRNLQFPQIEFEEGDTIGIVSHAAHIARLMRILNKFNPLPKGINIQAYPLVFENEYNEKEFVQSELRGIVGYISRGLATHEAYPYKLEYGTEKTEKVLGVKILPIDESDMKSVYDLSNSNSVRQNSFNPNPIQLESHMKWFERKLKDESVVMLKAVVEQDFAGQARLEIVGDAAVIGISVDDRFRGKGVASSLLQDIINVARNRGLKTIEAYIKPSNQASIKLFEKNGFIFQEQTEVSSQEALKYILDI